MQLLTIHQWYKFKPNLLMKWSYKWKGKICFDNWTILEQRMFLTMSIKTSHAFSRHWNWINKAFLKYSGQWHIISLCFHHQTTWLRSWSHARETQPHIWNLRHSISWACQCSRRVRDGMTEYTFRKGCILKHKWCHQRRSGPIDGRNLHQWQQIVQ